MLCTIVHKNLSRMACLEIIIFLCSMITFMVSNCETESENSNKKVNLSKFPSELDLSSLEASLENEESLRKIVKRLAPEKNGVTGQPGVDFPALTTIPTTSFSCRGLKGGYYADLETNCQVFHICDNGRKISFLCPNGTIFQQSQLICDWWFKVDCSKSTELYEQSSEQLFEEERRRAETSRKKSKFDYQQSIEQQDRGQQDDYYDVQNLSYDGKQNGRIKPYEEPPQENQLQSNRERVKSSRHFDSANNFNRESNAQRDNDRLFGVNGFQSSNQPSNLKQQFDQFTRNTEEGNVNRYSTTNQDYYTASKKTQNYYVTNRNSNAQRDDKGTLKRLKLKGLRGNSTSTVSQRVTPAYTESTTFRGSNTSPVKESQQFAESAAFVGNRGNRFNENTGNTHHYYYQLYINRGDSTTRNPNYDPTTSRQDNENDVSTRRNDHSFPGTSTRDYYETTTQYPTPTATTVPYNDEIATESSFSTNSFANFDTRPTESLRFANTNYEYRGSQRIVGSNVRSSFVDKNYYNINNNRESNRAVNIGTIPSTARSYATTDTYRETTVTPTSSPQQRYTTTGYYQSPTSTASFRSNNFARGTERPVIDNRSNGLNSDTKPSGKNPSTISPGYRQNLISSTTTTEKPFKTTSIYQENTGKDLSPYDRSFTYKQGKVMSTLGPYVPFTRNYAYTSATSTTSRPTLYTPTVPTYTTKTSTPKSKYPTPTSSSKSKTNGSSEREHVLSMLHSLKNLEHSVPGLSDAFKGGERATNVSVPPDPSTLHSLALYFSTATENFNSNETTDSSLSIESAADDIQRSILSKKSDGTVRVPTSLLTRHTIDSYTELFKLKDDGAEIDNATITGDRPDKSYAGEDDDLELQQSGGSLDDLRKSNGTRLRELAQVFTHALSAYLLDPDTFKKVLTEIRPTEPSRTTLETDLWGTTTTPYPQEEEEEDDGSLDREKDEVLDFSDDSNDIRQKLTTTYPTTFELPSTTVQENVYETLSTLPSTYYTTPRTSAQDFFEYSTNLISLSPVSSNYFESSTPPTESTEFTAEANSTPYTSGFYNRNNEIDKGSVEPTEGHLPSSDESQNRVGGFQNNSATTIAEPYTDKISFVTTPISDNYVVSPTPLSPSMFVHMVTYNWNKKSTSKKPEQQLSPPFFDARSQAIRKGNDNIPASLRPENYPSTSTSTHNVRATTLASTKNYETSTEQPFKIPRQKSLLTEAKVGISLPTSRNSYTKFRNLYNRVDEYNIETTERTTPTTTLLTEFPVTTTVSSVETTTFYANDSNDTFEATNRKKEESKVLDNDHWTSSPAVTHLWETSVFVDPQRINYDLESDLESTVSTGTQFSVTDSRERIEYTPSFDDDTLTSSEESSFTDEDTSVQRSSRDKDSPTTFSLLPTSFTENTVTPKPLITTRSSITTTITSSITSTKSLAGQQGGLVTLLPYTAKSNGTENEIAEKLFGKLNASSTDTLMRVMKQADNNETVRQLVLLLIRHCNDPANNTLQREKEELLNALLRLPVNEFSSEESKNVVAEINQLNLPAVKPVNYARSGSTAPLITEPPVTTFRSRKSRKFRSTTENSANVARRSEKGTVSDENNSLQEDESFASDNRALELLRSLYTIATKWG
ncbi:mucin-3A-like isoform X4 [Apis dorsata]|uniref:mucin-3A-like isoform X4 n=1 Tax=Apis dorsata TaxID=7462 RepID=UPI0012931B81|nr:mucin-3A-like isoform X4 [Apis dorsata]